MVLVLASILLPLDYSRERSDSYDHYVTNWEDVGISNVVSAILVDWRAYDTLGETVVLFTAVYGVYILLGGEKR
ncbi:MAG: hydrogen gas-evolving membrane-bound hydrogenase subunit E [Thermoplasmata archaeon]